MPETPGVIGLRSRPGEPPRPVRVLVTGFGPFPGVPYNASAALVEALREGGPEPGVSLATAIVPVLWEKAIATAQAAIAEHRPDAILHFGVSKRASGFVIETRAHNFSGPKKDHAGEARGAGVLMPGRSAIEVATLPTQMLLAALKAAGYPATISKNAGRYLCNALFYSSLSLASGKGAPLVGFIHLPALGAETKVAPRLGMDDIVDGARILVRSCAEAVVGTNPQAR